MTTLNSQLSTYLRRWGLWLRLVESLTWGLWGVAAGLGAGLLLAAAARIIPLLTARWLVGLAALLLLVGLVLGLAIVWLRPRPLPRLARIFDHRFELAERLTTAVEIGSGRLRTTPAMATAQLADTLDAAARVDAGTMLPLRVSRRVFLVFGALVTALILSLWLPNPQEAVLVQRAAVRAAIEGQIEELEAAREEIAKTDGLTEAEREMLLQSLEEAMDALDEGRATPEEAVAALSEAERALARLQDPGAATMQAGLQRAAEDMADSELTRDIAEALAQKDYSAAAEALASYAGTKGEALTREEELELARELTEAAKSLAESDPNLAQRLAQAAQAIERGDIAQAREAIKEAAQQMDASGQRVQRQEAVEGTLAQLQEGREQIAQAGGTLRQPFDRAQGKAQGSAPPHTGQSPGRGGAGEQTAQGQGQQGGQSGGQQPGSGQQTQPGHHEDAGTGAPYDEVYVPYRLDAEGAGVDISREGDEGVPLGSAPLPVPQGGRAAVPYRQVYADYAAQAGTALESSYIPLGLKQYVRDYFSSLEP